MTPDWAALRQQVRPCAIGLVIWTAFLAFWQFAVPGDDASSPHLEFWLLTGAFAFLVPTSLVLAGSATRHLWRARRRLAALLPSTLLCTITWALPSFADSAGLGPAVSLWFVPVALLLSSLASAFFVAFAAPPEVPPSGSRTDGWTKAI